jgi:hypothetical protein
MATKASPERLQPGDASWTDVSSPGSAAARTLSLNAVRVCPLLDSRMEIFEPAAFGEKAGGGDVGTLNYQDND